MAYRWHDRRCALFTRCLGKLHAVYWMVLLSVLTGSASAAEPAALESELEKVRVAIAALPAAESPQNAERRVLLEGLEYAMSRQLAATSALAVSKAQLQDILRLAEEGVPLAGDTVDPKTMDKLLAEAISAERDLVAARTLVEMLEDQEQAERQRLERLMAQERAEVEGDTVDGERRSLTRLRLQQARETLSATAAERTNAEVLRNIKKQETAVARRRALDAAGLALDRAALEEYVREKRSTAERLTQGWLDRMAALGPRQRALGEARLARDTVDAADEEAARQALWRFEAERATVARLDLETLAHRIGIESAEIAIDIWNIRGEMMLTGSVSFRAQAEQAIERGQERVAVVREGFVSTQAYVQESLDALDAKLQGSEPGQGRVWLERQRRDLRAMRPVVQQAFKDLDALQVFLEGSRFHLDYLWEHRSLAGRLQDGIQKIWRVILEIWNHEIFTVEDTIEVDGEKVTGQLAITVKKVAVAMFLLTVGIWIAVVTAGFARSRLLRRGVSETMAVLSYRVANLVTITVLVILAFSVVNIPLTVFGFVGGALALGVGLGAQSLVNNFISGMILLMERPIEIGDVIDIDGTRGTVTKIASRYSQIRCFDGVDLLIPNSTLLERRVENLTRDDQNLRLTLRVGVAYGSPTRITSDCLLAAAREHGRILDKPSPFVLFEDFGDSALMFTLNVWVRLHPDVNTMVTMSDLRYMIEKNLREAGVVVAYPQRDVHLDVSRPIPVAIAGPARTPTDAESHGPELSPSALVSDAASQA